MISLLILVPDCRWILEYGVQRVNRVAYDSYEFAVIMNGDSDKSLLNAH